MSKPDKFFSDVAARIADAMGHYWAFLISVLVVIMWAVSGPFFGFSDTWQLIINTGTTVLTFLMVFVIQNTQNRDNAAFHLKLDEIITHLEGPRDEMAGAEIGRSQKDLKELRDEESSGAT